MCGTILLKSKYEVILNMIVVDSYTDCVSLIYRFCILFFVLNKDFTFSVLCFCLQNKTNDVKVMIRKKEIFLFC